MQVITETELLDRIRAFLARHDMAPTTFGRNATGEPQLISSIEGGRSPSLKVVSKIVDYMERTDAEAETRAKLAAPAEGPPPPSEAENELPFGAAPVKATGASSPISSSTNARPPSSAASRSSPTSSYSVTEAAK